MVEVLKNLWNDETAQGMVEYGLILALVAIVVIGALTLIGDNLNSMFERIAGEVAAETQG